MKRFLTILSLIFCSHVVNQAHANCYNEACYEPTPSECRASPLLSSPYIKFLGGAAFTNNYKSVSFKTGYYVGGAVGYKLGNYFDMPLSAEIEVAYQRADVDHFKRNGFKFNHPKGHLKTITCMGNVLYAFDCDLPVQPYVGAGLGYAHLDSHFSNNYNLSGVYGNYSVINEMHKKKSGFAWQAIAGLSYPIQKDISVSIEYRYFDMVNAMKNHKVGMTLTKNF